MALQCKAACCCVGIWRCCRSVMWHASHASNTNPKVSTLLPSLSAVVMFVGRQSSVSLVVGAVFVLCQQHWCAVLAGEVHCPPACGRTQAVHVFLCCAGPSFWSTGFVCCESSRHSLSLHSFCSWQIQPNKSPYCCGICVPAVRVAFLLCLNASLWSSALAGRLSTPAFAYIAGHTSTQGVLYDLHGQTYRAILRRKAAMLSGGCGVLSTWRLLCRGCAHAAACFAAAAWNPNPFTPPFMYRWIPGAGLCLQAWHRCWQQ